MKIVLINLLSIFISVGLVLLVHHFLGYYNSKKEILQPVSILQTMHALTLSRPFRPPLHPMPVYIVNLPRSVRRRLFMLNQLSDVDLKKVVDFVFVDAFDANTIVDSIPNSVSLVTRTRNSLEIHVQKGYESATHLEMACTVSHLQTIKRAWDDGCNYCVVAEDDASFSLFRHWSCSLDQLTSYIATDQPSIISLFHPTPLSAKDPVVLGRPRCGTVAYMINRAAMTMVQSQCFHTNMQVHIPHVPGAGNVSSDVFLYRFITNSYLTTRPYVYPMNADLPSVIHDSDTPEHIMFAIESITRTVGHSKAKINLIFTGHYRSFDIVSDSWSTATQGTEVEYFLHTWDLVNSTTPSWHDLKPGPSAKLNERQTAKLRSFDPGVQIEQQHFSATELVDRYLGATTKTFYYRAHAMLRALSRIPRTQHDEVVVLGRYDLRVDPHLFKDLALLPQRSVFIGFRTDEKYHKGVAVTDVLLAFRSGDLDTFQSILHEYSQVSELNVEQRPPWVYPEELFTDLLHRHFQHVYNFWENGKAFEIVREKSQS